MFRIGDYGIIYNPIVFYPHLSDSKPWFLAYHQVGLEDISCSCTLNGIGIGGILTHRDFIVVCSLMYIARLSWVGIGSSDLLLGIGRGYGELFISLCFWRGSTGSTVTSCRVARTVPTRIELKLKSRHTVSKLELHCIVLLSSCNKLTYVKHLFPWDRLGCKGGALRNPCCIGLL